MSRRRKIADPPSAITPSPPGAITAAFERQKHDFLARNAVHCPYLLVQLQPDLPSQRLAVIASFSFSADREWQHVDTYIPIAGLRAEGGPEPQFLEAFTRLEDGIGAARLARLFSPLTEEQRSAAGR